MRKLIFLLSVVLLLSGCAIRKTQSDIIPGEELSRPTYSSIYFFTVGSFFEAQGNYSVADMLYQKAMSSDVGSTRIRRQVLLNSLNLFAQGELDDIAMGNLISGAKDLIEEDANLIFAAYGFYETVADTVALDKATQLLRKKFPSSQADIQRFIFEYKYYGKPDVALLDSAFKHAQNEPRSLYALANIYPYFKPEMVRPTLWRYYEIDPGAQSRGMLALYIAEYRDLELARQYLATLSYPDDRAFISEMADAIVFSAQPALLVELRTEILATQDIDLIHSLALAALLADRHDVLEGIESSLSALPVPEADKQAMYALLIARSLRIEEQKPLEPFIAKLGEISQFDEVLAIYNLSLTRDFNIGWAFTEPSVYEELINVLKLRLGDTAPARYLQAVAKAARDSLNTELPAARYELILDLKTRTVLSEKDYEYLLNYYYSQQMYAQRRELLNEAQSSYPENPLFCNDLGYSLLTEGKDRKQAAKLIRRALAVEPDNPFYLDSYAWYHYLEGDFEQALELSTLSKELEEMPAEIAWHIGAIYFQLADYDNARTYLQKSIDAGADPEIAEQAGQLLKTIP